MKIIEEGVLLNAGYFGQSKEYNVIHSQIYEAIRAVVWPPGNEKFVIRPGRHINGITPIKREFIKYLVALGWKREQALNLRATQIRPGGIDARVEVLGSHYAVEWETGNISSSHRAINKMVLGLLGRVLLGGTLVLLGHTSTGAWRTPKTG